MIWMKIRGPLASLALLVVAIGAFNAITASGGEAGKAPDPPVWVNPDGTVNEALLPATVPVVDENGELVKCNGKPLKVKARSALPPRPGTEINTADKELVPRCGKDGGVVWQEADGQP